MGKTTRMYNNETLQSDSIYSILFILLGFINCADHGSLTMIILMYINLLFVRYIMFHYDGATMETVIITNPFNSIKDGLSKGWMLWARTVED